MAQEYQDPEIKPVIKPSQAAQKQSLMLGMKTTTWLFKLPVGICAFKVHQSLQPNPSLESAESVLSVGKLRHGWRSSAPSWTTHVLVLALEPLG